jgi:hypothetical protein
MCAGHQREPRGNPRSTWKNFRDSDAPLPRRLQMVWANYLRRFQLRQNCCGNYGEPGC